MAGGEAGCREVAELLTADNLDDVLAGYPHAGGDEWSNADFTVEHLEPADEPGVLGRLGGYDVLEIIGRGGMGVVLKAFDRELKRCVAIKVLAPHLAQSSLAKKRFAREAQAAAAVVHPNVLAIHQVQPAGRLPFLVMPLVAGESLAQRLTARGRLELKEILRIGMQAAAGLSAAHEQGLVHRDVKPANILLEKGIERAVLTDFGLARAADDVSMTRWGIIAGTPQYMSPEQAKGEPLDGRSDLFSLGCVLYEMATGVSPFRADSTLATLRRLIDDPPPAMASHDPELPPWFIRIVERLLEKDASRRFGSAKEVSELLEGCLAHLQQPASVPLPANVSGTLRVPMGIGTRSVPDTLLPVSDLRNRRTTLLFKGTLVMIATLGIGLLSMLAMQATEPQDIAGQWTGEGWGQVVLTQTAPGEYTGTYTDTVGKEQEPGRIDLKWSRIERRFNGTWRESDDDRFGDLSIHLVGNEIRGGLTTDGKSKINPATPRLAELTWTRAGPSTSAAAAKLKRQADLIVTRTGLNPLSATLPAKVAAEIEALDGVEATCGGLVDFQPIEECGGEPIEIQGWPAGNYMFGELKIVQGTNLSERDRGRKAVVIGTTLADVEKLKVGQTITISDEKFHVAGVFESAEDLENGFVIMLLDDAQKVFGKPGLITGCTVNVKDTNPEGVAAIRAAIEGPIADKFGLKGKIRAKSPWYANPPRMPSVGEKATGDQSLKSLTFGSAAMNEPLGNNGKLDIGKAHWTGPKSWVLKTPKSTMLQAEYAIPGPKATRPMGGSR
jgi:serine/threonine protein kinase